VVDYLDGKYSNGLLFLDQSLISGAETYGKNSFGQGNLTHQTRNLYQSLLELGIDRLGRNEQEQWCEQLIVYLRIKDPEILLRRIRQRATPGEVVGLEYLTQMIKVNEKFITDKDDCYTKYGLNPPRVLTIDASEDFTQNGFYHRQVVEQIIAKLKEG
jgi:deoxyadenosine/deoxycytidine kinase